MRTPRQGGGCAITHYVESTWSRMPWHKVVYILRNRQRFLIFTKTSVGLLKSEGRCCFPVILTMKKKRRIKTRGR